MTAITVRAMNLHDRASWATMRAALWPEESREAHEAAIDEILGGIAWGFIAESEDGAPAGFAEVAIRPYANGCDSRPVPFLEGIWIAPAFRRKHIGAKLVAHIESFLNAKGFHEIGSDALLDNAASQTAHRRWGFAETERVVYFRKALGKPGGP